MIKLIVMDLDGTARPHGQSSLSDRTKYLIDQLLAKGKTIAFSSGRTYEQLMHYVSEWEQDFYFCCCEGACTVYRGKEIYGKKIETEDLQKFFKQAKGRCSFLLHSATTTVHIGDVGKWEEHFRSTPIQKIGDISNKIFKITALEELPLTSASGLRYQWNGGKASVTQYVNRFANKGAALSDLQMRLAISSFETACIGDSDNDISMMRNAKRTYCVGHRSEELYQMCNRHVDRIETALEELLAE